MQPPLETRKAVLQAVIVLVVFLVAGAACGWLWHQIWAPAPTGFAYQNEPVFDDDVVFRGTGLYMVIGLTAGLVLCAVATWFFEADEVLTLAAVALGSVAAGWLMVAVGSALGPESMYAAAQGAEDFTVIEANLEAGSLVPWIAFPGGALVGAVVVLVAFTSGPATRSQVAEHPVSDRYEP